MPATARVTVTLPSDVVRDIDQLESNRSRFILDAVRHELERRRRQRLRESLDNPHPEAADFADAGFDEWADGLPEEGAADLVAVDAGTPIRWVEGRGWVKGVA